MLQPRFVIVNFVTVTAPAALRSQFAHLYNPFLKVNTRDVWSLQLQAKSDAELEYFDDWLLSQLLNLDLFNFISLLCPRHHLKFVYLVNAHLLVQKHGIHMMRVFVEAWLLNSSTSHFLIDQSSTFATTLPGESRLTYQSGLVKPDLRRVRLTVKAPIILLWHLSPLRLAFLDYVHSNLHPQVLLIVAKLVVHGL